MRLFVQIVKFYQLVCMFELTKWDPDWDLSLQTFWREDFFKPKHFRHHQQPLNRNPRLLICSRRHYKHNKSFFFNICFGLRRAASPSSTVGVDAGDCPVPRFPRLASTITVSLSSSASSALVSLSSSTLSNNEGFSIRYTNQRFWYENQQTIIICL
jgi:hypothetical protein